MFYVYVLRSGKTGRRYVGFCEDLDDRLRRHNAGESKATKHGIPWTLLHTERFSTRTEALERERYYKTGRGRDELDQLLITGRMNPTIFILALIFASLLGSLGFALAQEPSLPAKSATPEPAPVAIPSASSRPQLNIPDIPIEPPQLVPDASPGVSPAAPTSKSKAQPLSELDAAFKRSPLGQLEEEHRLHIAWRELQNRA